MGPWKICMAHVLTTTSTYCLLSLSIYDIKLKVLTYFRIRIKKIITIFFLITPHNRFFLYIKKGLTLGYNTKQKKKERPTQKYTAHVHHVSFLDLKSNRQNWRV